MESKKAFLSLIIILFFAGLMFFIPAKADNLLIENVINYIKSQPQSPWSVMALASAGADGIDASFLKNPPQNPSALEYAKYILALTSIGEDPTKFGSENYVQKLEGFYNSSNLQFGDSNLLTDDAWAILALGSVGKDNSYKIQNAKNFILQNQNADGGWGYAIGAGSDTNDTAAIIMALLETGLSPDSSETTKSANYLKSAQNEDGGFAYDPNSAWGKDSDSASDAWIAAAIYKLGQDPASWTKNGKNPIDHIKSLQDSDGGIWWQDPAKNPLFNNKSKTADCLIALSSKFFPVYSKYNSHALRIEGENKTVCTANVNGATPMELVINGSKECNYSYAISNQWEDSMGLFLQKIEGSEGWWIYANNISLPVSPADYYLKSNDNVLLNYIGQDYSTQWAVTNLEISKTQDSANFSVKYFDESQKNWKNLEIEGIKLKIGATELMTDSLGKAEVNPNSVQPDSLAFVERQILDGKGYIKSEEIKLDGNSGQKGSGGQTSENVGLRVEIDKGSVSQESSISFSVTPDLLDFGKIKPGESSVKALKITNNGVGIRLESEISGDSTFQDNLQIDGNFWQMFLTDMEKNQEKDLEVKLTIPSNYSNDGGVKEGELIFWATKK